MIGIPVLNRVDLLATCVRHIDVDDRIILVVNSSNANVLRELDELAKKDRRLELLPQGRNIGVAASWNLLRKLCDDEWVTIGSNDCFLKPGSLQSGRSMAFASDAGTLYLSASNFFMWSRRCVDAVGWYDDSGGFYPAYCEDCDYGRRMDLAGVRRLNVPGAGGEHLGSQTVRSDPRLQWHNRRTHAAGIRYYCEKWGGPPGKETFTLPFGRMPLSYWGDLGEENRRKRSWDDMDNSEAGTK